MDEWDLKQEQPSTQPFNLPNHAKKVKSQAYITNKQLVPKFFQC